MRRGKRSAGPVRLPRAHRVLVRLKGSKVAIYWYRRRGEKPAMAVFRGDTLGAALEAERAGVQELLKRYSEPRALPPVLTVRDLVTRYKAASDGFLKLRRDTTRKIWAPWLDQIIEEFGGAPIQALSAKAFRRDIIEWRNRWANRPRSADYAIQVLQRVLSWSVENALIDENPAAGIKGLYSPSANSRAHVIVEPHELEAVLGHMSKHAALAVRLAAETGLRRGDLVDLRWNELRDTSIERVAQKSRRGRRVIVPLTREAQAVIAELREMNRGRAVPSTHVLFSRQGPWTGIGLGSVWWKACQKAGVDKHFHDLRGTAATRFCMVPFSDEEVADIMGWEPGQVRVIRKRYVDRERIAAGLVARMEQAQKERG